MRNKYQKYQYPPNTKRNPSVVSFLQILQDDQDMSSNTPGFIFLAKIFLVDTRICNHLKHDYTLFTN